jgi:diadenosine tetraphosphatase ApaH/serine/threonine PP2A family protein phosphatase
MTRYAIISDVHSNFEALEAVAADLTRYAVDRLVCCGDVVGYGAEPLLCIERARDLLVQYGESAHVLGNHDHATVSGEVENFSTNAAIAALWTRDRLSSTERRWLSEAPLIWSENNLLFTHGSPTHPEKWRYLWDPQQIEREFSSFSEQVCFVGHTHEPFICVARAGRFASDTAFRIPAGKRCIVNVGSVGQPRDGDPRAAYCIYDDVDQLLSIHRVQYDIHTAARKIIRAGLPEALAERLFFGF